MIRKRVSILNGPFRVIFCNCVEMHLFDLEHLQTYTYSSFHWTHHRFARLNNSSIQVALRDILYLNIFWGEYSFTWKRMWSSQNETLVFLHGKYVFFLHLEQQRTQGREVDAEMQEYICILKHNPSPIASVPIAFQSTFDFFIFLSFPCFVFSYFLNFAYLNTTWLLYEWVCKRKSIHFTRSPGGYLGLLDF